MPHKIENVNNRLMELIRNASKYSRLAEMDHVDCQGLDLNTLLLDALAGHEERIRAAGIVVNFLPAGEHPITANPMIEDVFANIIANAVKYAGEGKKLEIDIRNEDRCWVVLVRDFGRGIPDQEKPNVFTRFHRIKKEGVEGSGLGLAIVKRLVDLHKGRIWIEDNPAGGSVFCVRLPKAGPAGPRLRGDRGGLLEIVVVRAVRAEDSQVPLGHVRREPRLHERDRGEHVLLGDLHPARLDGAQGSLLHDVLQVPAHVALGARGDRHAASSRPSFGVRPR